MATAAQCIANAANAQHSTGPNTEAGKAKVASNGVTHGLFAAYERLAPAETELVNGFMEQLRVSLPVINPIREEIIRQYAIAKWRSEYYYRMEAAFFVAAIAAERAIPESAAVIQEYGEDILMGNAILRDAAGPNALTKLMRYESRVLRELKQARDAYNQLLDYVESQRNNPKPISVKPQPDTAASETQTPRNAPCTCGSGNKYKRCCGAGAPAQLCA